MGWQDRDYARSEVYESRVGGPGPLASKNWSICTILLITNVALFLLAPSVRGGLFEFLVLDAASVLHGQIWRLVTPCFLHWDMSHLFFNMLALYFFGPALEALWGWKKFLTVYLVSGIIANTLYVLLFLMGWDEAAGLAAGASGCLYAILGALAVLMPHIRVLVFFIIPMTIRTFLTLFVFYGLYMAITGGLNAGGEVVHLAGLACGVGYAFWQRRGGGFALPRPVSGVRTIKAKITPGPGAWDQKMQQEQEIQARVDEILAKVHTGGLDSLSEKEKDFLAEASKKQQRDEGQFGRTDRL